MNLVAAFYLRFIPSKILNSGCLSLVLVFSTISVAIATLPQTDRHDQALQLDSDPPQIRIMSFNIRYGSARDGANRWDLRKEFLAETIEAFDPDLLGTQETLLAQKDFLDQRLTGFQSIGVGRDDGQKEGEMTALWFRTNRFQLLDSGHFWLSETPQQPGSVSWDSALTRMVSWVKLADVKQPQAPNILFLNTHFDHVGKQARVESIKLLLNQIGTLGIGCSVILTGDFNAGESSEPYRTLFDPAAHSDRQKNELEQGDQARQDQRPFHSLLIDTYRHVHRKASENEGTFSGFKSDQTSGARIDWIAVSSDWQVIAAQIDRTARLGRTPSDHFPVTAILRLIRTEKEDRKPNE